MFTDCVGIEELVIPDTVTTIESCAFEDCVNLKNVVIGESVTTIGFAAFENCSSLNQVNLPAALTEIQDSAFRGCTSLASAVIPDSVTTIGNYAFYGCSSLKEVQLPQRITTLADYTFQNSGITEITVPEGVKSLGSGVFQNCDSLVSVSLPKTLKTMGTNVFNGCQLLETVSIPDYTITTIPTKTFYECGALKDMVIPKGVTKINALAFGNSPALTSVEIPQTVTQIAADALSYPGKTTIQGCTGSYAETFAHEKGFTFEAIDNPAYGIAPADDRYEIVLDRYEYRRLEFLVLPEDTTDIITLSCDNNKVDISGLQLYARYSGDCTVTATTTGGMTCEISVHIRTPQQLVVKEMPAKTSYFLGEDFDASGLVLEMQYDDGSTQTIDGYTISGFDSSREGTCSVKFTFVHPYRTFSTTLEVTIVDPAPKLESIILERLPDKLIYLRGELLDMSGAQVIGVYSDGSREEITEYETSGYNALRTGKQTITVSSQGKTAIFTVEVVLKRIERLEITHLPDKLEYLPGEELQLDGLIVVAHYTDGSQEEIADYAVSKPEMSPGEKEVILTAQDKTVSFTVTVKEVCQEHVFGELIAEVPATCGVAGMKAHYECAVCHKLFDDSKVETTIDQLIIPALEHVPEAGWHMDANNHWKICANQGCGVVLEDEKAAHDFVWEVDRPATEDQPGLKHEECTVCGYCRNENTEIPVLPHTHTGIAYHAAVAATCKSTGVAEYWSCSSTVCAGKYYGDASCTVELESVITPIDPTNHAGETEIRDAVAPTPEHDGYSGDVYCVDCGALIEKGETIPATEGSFVEIYRLYNPGNGKHHYTSDASERDFLAENGWIYEGIAWNAPKEGAPIYRVYNPGNDNHLYTMDAAERDRLVAGGWNYEGILCYSAGSDGVPLYRVFNPYVTLNPHHYTDSLEECDFLESHGWRVEGISWYGLK